jgi:hypothetical protein
VAGSAVRAVPSEPNPPPKWRLLCKPFGEFDEDAPIGLILDFPECDDEPQTFDDVQIDLIIPNQPS